MFLSFVLFKSQNIFCRSDIDSETYRPIVSGYHQTIFRDQNGYYVFGQNFSTDGVTDILSPTPMTPANGFNYNGRILFVGIGSESDAVSNAQGIMLTTTNLYVCGTSSKIIIIDKLELDKVTNSPLIRISLPFLSNIKENVKDFQATLGEMLVLSKSGNVYLS